jgi:ABC-2 type transport system ATP-binding protein
MDLRVRRMSRGTRQKLGLFMALVHQSRLLILDEPTSGLDPVMQSVLADYLRQLAAAGHTIFFSSHTLREVETLCDRVAVVRQGRIVADESLQSLRARALRTVEVLFADEETAARATVPPFLHNARREGRRVRGELEGPAPPLLRWAAQQEIDDVIITPPDLETLFRKFYESENRA